MFEPDQAVRFVDPLTNGQEIGTFQEVAVNEPIEVESPACGGTRLADTAWIRREDGIATQVVYAYIKPSSLCRSGVRTDGRGVNYQPHSRRAIPAGSDRRRYGGVT